MKWFCICFWIYIKKHVHLTFRFIFLTTTKEKQNYEISFFKVLNLQYNGIEIIFETNQQARRQKNVNFKNMFQDLLLKSQFYAQTF
jgi:hypothetical protein